MTQDALHSAHTLWQRVTLLAFALSLACVAPALADSSFLLQLGTFASREEAQGKWNEVQSGNPDVVGKLQGHIAEVMLPPDNIPSYRTQAGPVNSRREAKSMCKNLQQRGVNCLIVETAFAATDLAPEMAGDVASPSPVRTPEPPAPAAEPAVAPEQQITTSAVAPVEAPQTQEPSPREPVAAANPAPQKTYVRVTRRAGSYSNPNDAKKPGFFRGAFRFNNQEETTEEVTTSETTPAPVAVASAAQEDDDKPGFFGRLFGRSSKHEEKTAVAASEPAPAPAPVPVKADTAVKGDVEVAEAIRVPVSSDESPSPAKYQTISADNSSNSPLSVVDGDSSSAYWVQISYFKTEARAYAFYNRLKAASPQTFAKTRMRVTKPFVQNKRASLRVGPFASQDEAQSICSAAETRSMRCTLIHDDTPTAPVAAAPRAKRYPSPLEAVDIPAYRNKPSADSLPTGESSAAAPVAPGISDTGIAAQWVNLGQYASSQEAWSRWKDLQAATPALQKVKPAITGMLGSKNFQLRAGPFDTDIEAENICQILVKAGNTCQHGEAQ